MISGGGGKHSKSFFRRTRNDSIGSSIGSRLNHAGTSGGGGGGPADLTSVSLTDDYFSDVNVKSVRRLMNVIYVMGRLMKAFNIDFSWYHLAVWVNLSEQWPYRYSDQCASLKSHTIKKLISTIGFISAFFSFLSNLKFISY